MVNRVSVQITARDLTRGQLAQMRRNFRNLGVDMDRVLTQRTRGNFDRLGESVRQASRDLNRLRGSIPEDEFRRLAHGITQAQRQMSRGFSRTTMADLQRVSAQLRGVRDGFRRLDTNARIRVRVDDSDVDRTGRTMGNRLTRSATSPVRTAGRLLGGTLSDGVGQGVSNGFKGIGPIMGAILLAAILGSLAVLGGALSALLVTALGAAFVSVGGLSAAMSERVKAQWSKSVKSMKKDFESVGEPMIPVLERAIQKLEDMSSRVAPKLKKALEEAVPFTNQFIDQIMAGFERFGENAFKPIMDAWAVFAPVFGEVFSNFMSELGDSFKEMANLVAEHPEEIRMALQSVFEMIDLLVDAVTFLGKAWVFLAQNAGDAFGFIIQGVRFLMIAVNEALYAILDGATQAFGWIPGLGGKLKDARAAFKSWKDGVAADLESAAESAFSWDNALNQANRKRKLEVSISEWQARLTKARADLKRTSDQKAKAKLQADITDLESKILRARSQLAGLNGKSATVTIATYYQTYGAKPPLASAGRLAHGGIKGAANGGVRKNLTMVGEHGPELVRLPPGAHVRSNPDTRRDLRAASGGNGSGPNVLMLKSAGGAAADLVLELLRAAVKPRGGNVQLAVMGK